MEVRRKRLGGTATNQITGRANHQLTALYELVARQGVRQPFFINISLFVAAVILFTAINILINLTDEEKITC